MLEPRSGVDYRSLNENRVSKKGYERFLQTAHLLGGQIGTIVPTKIQREIKMTTIAFQTDELCSECGYLTNPKIGYSTCVCEE